MEYPAYQRCCLFDIMFCDEENNAEELLRLSCGHFYHKECISGFVRTELYKTLSQRSASYIPCYQCVEERVCCDCDSCRQRNDHSATSHHLTEQEVESLVAEGHLSQKDKRDWERLSWIVPGCVEITCPHCDTAFGTSKADLEQDEILCPAADCRKGICPQCKFVSHIGVTCKRLQDEILIGTPIGDSSPFIQECPNCSFYWNVPIEGHGPVTCEGPDGCGQEFCFFCAAPYTPIQTHGMWYHRPGCAMHCLMCDCVEEHGVPICLSTNPLTTCAKSKYWPGPCDACIGATTNNSCTHGLGNWRACNACIRYNRPCRHYCLECRKKGSLCTPPGNPPDPDSTNPRTLKYRIFDKQAVEAECRWLYGHK